MTDAEHPARERIQRTLLFALGISGLIFGGLMATGASGFLAQIGQLRSPWGIASIVVGVGVPVLYPVLSRVMPVRPLLALAGGTSLAFLAIQVAWPALMIDPFLADDATPWLQGVNAIHATALAIAWPRPLVWLFPLIQGPVVAMVQVQVREDSSLEAVLDGLGAVIFCLIVTGVSVALIAAGDRQDSAAEHAREQAALEATRRTREAEQTRINAIVHDDVMSVLLAASRATPPEGLADQARRAMTRVDTLASGRSESRDYDPEEFVAVVRSTAAALAPEVPVRYAVNGDSTLPAGVVAAFAEATAEAMRNALGHAGPECGVRVEIDIDDASARVVVADQGRGFSPSKVSQRRLGIRVSILERMRAVARGDAEVASSPGAGTTVTLSWSRA